MCVSEFEMVEMYYTEHGLPIEEDKEWWKYEERYTMGMEDDERYKNVVAMDEKVLKLHLKENRGSMHILQQTVVIISSVKKCIGRGLSGRAFWYAGDFHYQLCSAEFDRLLAEERFGFRSF